MAQFVIHSTLSSLSKDVNLLIVYGDVVSPGFNWNIQSCDVSHYQIFCDWKLYNLLNQPLECPTASTGNLDLISAGKIYQRRSCELHGKLLN